MTLWRTRDVYRARRGVQEWVILFLLLEGLMFVTRGRWDFLVAVIGLQVAMLWGFVWLVRTVWSMVRGRWHGLMIVLVLCTLCSGCADMALGVARLYGYKGDPNPCTPASFQAGTCVTAKEGGK